MNVKELAEKIESYLTYEKQLDVDELFGPYAVKGIFMEESDIERIEVGMASSGLYKPLIQLKLGDVPEIESLGKSYLDVDDFAGDGYRLFPNEYMEIERLIKE